MTDDTPDCPHCLDEGIVCENHPGKPWEGTLAESEGGCGCGAGMPCPRCCSPIPGDGTHAIAEAFVPDRQRTPPHKEPDMTDTATVGPAPDADRVADRTGKAYRKVGALIIRDRRMLLISATAAPDVYSMPGGPQRWVNQTIALAEELHAELGLTLVRAELWGEYEVVSGIDGVLVRSMIYLTEADGEPRALQEGRRWLWADRIEGLNVSTTVAAVHADAVAQGLIEEDGPDRTRN